MSWWIYPPDGGPMIGPFRSFDAAEAEHERRWPGKAQVLVDMHDNINDRKAAVNHERYDPRHSREYRTNGRGEG